MEDGMYKIQSNVLTYMYSTLFKIVLISKMTHDFFANGSMNVKICNTWLQVNFKFKTDS